MSHVSYTADQSDDSNAWKLAKQVAETLKPLPIAFTSSIRLLVSDHLKHNGEVRPVTKFQIARIFRSKSFRAMLYFSCAELKQSEFNKFDRLTVGDLMNFYTAGDLAGLIGMYVFFKKARRLVSDSEWSQMRPEVIKRLQAGAAIGGAIPKIGVGAGVLMAGMPFFVLCTLYKYDDKIFTQYRRFIQKNDYQFDIDKERELWGCDTRQIASLALSSLGFGVDISEAYMMGFDRSKQFHQLRKDLHVDYHMARIWTDTLLAQREQPMDTVPGEYFPLQAARSDADTAVALINDSYRHWFERTSGDISETVTPKLFASNANVQDGLEVPEELQEVFSLEEITAMQEEDFDDLVDQMDLENAGQVAVGDVTMDSSAIDSLDDI